MAPLPQTQSLIVQNRRCASSSIRLPLMVANDRPLPELHSDHDVLIRVLAVGLNPTDCKMVQHFYMEGTPVGCDFCGIVERAGPKAGVRIGTRVIAGHYPYRPNNLDNGAFAEYAVGIGWQTITVPDHWSDTMAAGLGLISWATVAMAMTKPGSLELSGRPSAPADKAIPVLVYGGGTATGFVAIQMLKQSGYTPIAVCSERSAERAKAHGAIGTVPYTAPDCVEQIKKLARGVAIKHALDCITNPASIETCFAALARLGARYACLEHCPDSLIPRLSVKISIILSYEQLGYDVDLGDSVYSRTYDAEQAQRARQWGEEIVVMMNKGDIEPLPIRELQGFSGVLQGLEDLNAGKVQGNKLVARISK
ncbi:Zinc-binding dehydrogenase family oxidoreductase [Teratosphaeria destructans]|uniref:Zinc-binding dehydrogenase family oxidoreductase n=1 Tax=Teratosphaeria destructans TaxID=418781 RepID=A0A9W7SV15_9PEZI|nr:Zinc-binding dehydrogenase family oxidoreductase [Teratosphaeria destructans]